MTEPLLARIVRRGGGKLLDVAAGRLFPEEVDTPGAKGSLGRTIAGAAITRLATRSVPGALVVASTLLAKSLFDRRLAKKEQREQAQRKQVVDDTGEQ
jgi:hypothetical protein